VVDSTTAEGEQYIIKKGYCLNGQVFGNNRDRDIEVAQSQNGFLIETGGSHPDESVARAVGFMVKPTGV
jgi:hypothetical protein